MCLQPGSNNRIRCSERGLSVSARFGVHPTCRPAARAAAGLPREPNVGDTLPSFDAILLGRTRTLRHLPAAARYLWTKVLTRALAVVHHNDARAWQELLMLPQAVLDAPGQRPQTCQGCCSLHIGPPAALGKRRAAWALGQPAATSCPWRTCPHPCPKEGACHQLGPRRLWQQSLCCSAGRRPLQGKPWDRGLHPKLAPCCSWPKLCAASRLPQLPALPAYLTMWTRSCNSSL